MKLVEHLESHLGPIASGWKAAGGPTPFHILRFADQPQRGATTFTTLGLSNSILELPKNRFVRQEFIFSAHDRYKPRIISSILVEIGEFVHKSGKALLRGDLAGTFEAILPSASTRVIYCTVPVMFRSDLSTFSESVPPTVLVWLIPITIEEANFVKEKGWSKFEDLLERHDVDFWDLDRKSIWDPLKSN